MIRTTPRGVIRRMLGATALALATAGAANAAVIGFEGKRGPAYNQDAFQEAGYTVVFYDPAGAAPPGTVQVGRFIDGSDPASCGLNTCPTNNASTYVDLFNSGFIDILPTTSGATFRFSGLDASFIGTQGVDYPATPAAIQVIGFLADGSDVRVQFNLPDITEFQGYTASEEFARLDFTEIAIVAFSCNAEGNCGGLDNGLGQVGLDNIRLSDLPVSVPEPATASLLAFGLLGLGARARRRT